MNFLEPFDENMGGALYFYFTLAENVLSVTFAPDHKVTGLNLKAGASLSAGYSTPETLSLQADPVETEQGTYYPIQIKGFYPRPPAQLIAEFSNMVNRKFIVLIKDGNGNNRMAGTQDQPLTFSFSENTLTRAKDNPGASYSFTGNTDLPPYFYTPILDYPSLGEHDDGQTN